MTSAPSIAALFDRAVTRFSRRIAVTDELGSSLTYAQLSSQVDRLARRLQTAGMGVEDRCALLLDRSALVPIAMLAVLKAGAAYVPIDLETPVERVAACLEDSSVALILVDRAGHRLVPRGPWRTLAIDDRDVPGDDALPVRTTPVPSLALAYIMYTSGSAGRPKGVLIDHGNVVAFVEAARELYAITEEDAFVQVASVSFDVITFDVFASLLSGASLHVAASTTRRSRQRFLDLLARTRTSIYMGTPAMIDLVDPCAVPALRTIAIGGDPVPAALAARWREGRRFFNSYGPTETTVGVLTHFASEEDGGATLPIGTPMRGHQAYLLDETLRPVPVGNAGELCIAGPGVGRGYAGAPSLTAASFVPNPWGLPGSRMYRTGDLVRSLPSGEMEFLGRRDRQVKVRGMRVELAEIEATITSRAGATHCVVEGIVEGGSTRLIAFVTPATLDGAVLREAVAAYLPAYMIPSEVYALTEIPRTIVGKVDHLALLGRRALLKSAAIEARTSASSEATPLERLLIDEIVGPIVEVTDLSPDTDLFDLGIDSLQIIRLVAAIESEFELELELSDLYRAATVAGIGDLIERTRAERIAAAVVDTS